MKVQSTAADRNAVAGTGAPFDVVTVFWSADISVNRYGGHRSNRKIITRMQTHH